jgi:O-antigen ligase
VSSAIATVGIGVVIGTKLIEDLIGRPGLVAMLASTVVLAAITLFVRRHELEWHGLLPLSLLAFVGWCTLSLVWSDYTTASVSGVLYQLAVGSLALYVALLRDVIQIVRAFGDVLRVTLGTSLVLEVLAGLLLDMPFPFLGIQGTLAAGGPVQGIFETRNLLGFMSLLAVVTFAVELATRSVQRSTAIASLVLASLLLVFSRSPVTGAVLVLLAAAVVALASIRRLPAERRTAAQLAVAALALVTAVVVSLSRPTVIRVLSAGGELEYRLSLWRRVETIAGLRPLEGWGWVGEWRPMFPFTALRGADGRMNESALNAYFDAWFQVGLVGVVLLVVLLALATIRAWVLASTQHSVVFVWPALVMLLVAATSLAESYALVEVGWLLVVIVAVKSSQRWSWRRRLSPAVTSRE